MANIIYVDTLDHPGLDAFARLTEAQLRNRKEPEKGIFIAESPKVIERALNGGYEPLSFLMEEKHITGQAQPLLDRCPGVPVYTGPSDLLAQLTGFPLTRGVLCAMRRPLLPTVEQLCRNAHRVAVLEGIADPTNVGAIFRSAAAMHMDAVLVTPNCCDPLYRRSVRVSMGTVFQIPWTRIPQWPEGGLEQLHRQVETAEIVVEAGAVRGDREQVPQPLLLWGKGDVGQPGQLAYRLEGQGAVDVQVQVNHGGTPPGDVFSIIAQNRDNGKPSGTGFYSPR